MISFTEKPKKTKTASRKLSEKVDGMVSVLSPKWAFGRRQYRMAYDAIDGSRTRKKRVDQGGTGDSHLTETALYDLREACRDLGRNNPLIKGLLATERNGVVGSNTAIQSQADDSGRVKEVQALW